MRVPFFSHNIKRISVLFAIGMLVVVGFAGTDVYAQVDASSLSQFQESTGLGNEDLTVTIGKIVRTVLGFLGVLAVIIVLYAGFMWMTAGGNEDRIATAKKILIQGGIGLLIILAAFSITHFVVTKLADATGTDPSVLGVDGGGIGGSGGGGGGGGGLKNFVVTSISPSGKLPNYNVTAHVLFSSDVDAASAEKSISLRKVGSVDAVPVTVSVKGGHVTLKPQASCPGSDVKGCLEKSTAYTLEVASGTNGVKSKSGKALVCGIGSSCSGTFTTGDQLDLKAPTAAITSPTKDSLVGQGLSVPITAVVSDDLGVTLVDFYVNNELIDTVTVSAGASLPTTVSSNAWDTSNLSLGSNQTIFVRVYDVDDHSTESSSVSVKVTAAHCFDGVKTEGTDEIGKDCSPKGGTCGLCSGSSCEKDSDCESGFCAVPATPGASGKQCLSVPLITGMSPGSGGEGQWVTIQGKYFGSQGSVYFIDTTDGKNTKIPAAKAVCGAGVNTWSDTAVIIEVPKGLVADKIYPILIENASGSDATNDDRGPVFKDAFAAKTAAAPVPGLCAVAPTSEKPGATVTFIGKNFTTDTSKQIVWFGGKEGTIRKGATTTQFNAIVPNISVGKTFAEVSVNGVKSNAIPFTVQGEGGKPAPAIVSLSAEKGPSKQYLTITGKNFGDFQNLVKFIKLDDKLVPTDVVVYGDFSFPKMCTTLGTWKDGSIILKVPETGIGKYHVVVVRTDADNDPSNNESNSAVFEVTTGTPPPGLCAIAPSSGPIGTATTLYGELFGSDAGSVTFWKDKTISIAKSNWNTTAIDVTVPKDATSGPAAVTTAQGAKSNEAVFLVQNCNEKKNACGANEQCCGNGSCIPLTDGATGKPLSCGSFAVPDASYTFAFFTGTSKGNPNDFPPSVIEECSGGKLPSPSPWEKHPGGTSVCVTAQVGIKFSIPIDQNTLVVNKGANSTVQLYKCTGEDGSCALFADTQTAIDSGSVSYINKADGDGTSNSDQSYFSFAPQNPLDTGGTYMVVLTDGITGAKNGMTMLPKTNCKGTPAEGKGAYCFRFVVSETGSTCTLGSVLLSPAKYVVDTYDDVQAGTGYILDPTGISTTAADGKKTTTFKPLIWGAKGIAKSSQCILVNACGSDAQWEWNSNQTDVASPVMQAKQCEAFVKVVGESKKILNQQGKMVVTPAVITAKEMKSSLSDTSDVTVSYGPPKVIEQCGEEIQSPTPWSNRAGGNSVCVNAVVNAVFTQIMDPLSITNNTVYIQKCLGKDPGKECAEVSTKLGSALTDYLHDDTHSGVELKLENNQAFEPNTIYRVGFTTGLKSINGVSMDPNSTCASGESYCFTFKTRADAASCSIEDVQVTPTTYSVQKLELVTDKQNNPVLYRGKAVADDQCILLNGSSYAWTWTHAGQGIYDPATDKPVESMSDAASEQLMWAKTPTPKDDPSTIIAVAQGKSGLSRLHISVDPPAILQSLPSCEAACVTAEIGATFSKEMAISSIDLAAADGAANAVLLPCQNESCLFDTTAEGFLTPEVLKGALPLVIDVASGMYAEGNTFIYKLVFAHQPLQFNTYYRMFVGVGTKGLRASEAAGGRFISPESVPAAAQFPKGKPNYYSWIFKTKADGKPCAISSAAVEPKEAIVGSSGIVRQYAVKAYGFPDECSSSGQALQSSDFSWNWTIVNPEVAKFITNSAVDTVVAVDTPYCTKACIGKGSKPIGTPVCGDGIPAIGKGEECDDGNVENGDGCSAVCLNEGSEVLLEGGTCGNGKKDAYEDCDGEQGCSQTTCTWLGSGSGLAKCGNGDVGQGEECDGGAYCTTNCLWKGTEPGYAACQALAAKGKSCIGAAVCGNGTLEPGEDEMCEELASNGSLSPEFFEQACTNTCVQKGYNIKPDQGAKCGDGTVQHGAGEACDDGNGISGDGCSAQCLFEGSSAFYSNPSFCGDGEVGVGETPSCDQAALSGAGDGKIDPVQYVIGLTGGQVVDNKRQTAVSATIQGAKTGTTINYKSGLYTIQCGYTSDSQCSNALQQGVGSDSCCYPRPKVVPNSEKPSSGSSSICTNALLTVDFTDRMDSASLQAAGTVMLKGATATEAICTGAGGKVVEKYEVDPHDPWYRRAWYAMNNTLRGWFHVSPVYASVVCETTIEIDLADIQPTAGLGLVTSRLFITPKALLAKNTTYTATISVAAKNSKGVALKDPFNWKFTTGSKPCLLERVSIQPDAYVFTKKGAAGAGNFMAIAESKVGNVFQPISITNDYKWDWAWNITKSKHAVLQNASGASAVVEAGPEKGATILRATATITTDTFNDPSTTGDTFEGQAVLTNTLCEKPWPNQEVIGFSSFPLKDDSTHFATWYCMGELPSDPAAPSTLLPSLSINQVSTNNTPGLLRSLILRNPKNGDAIGIRVHENTNHLSPMSWYSAQGFAGNPKKVTVAGYEAVQDETTVYISAVNYPDATVADPFVAPRYTNIYIVSYNPDASEETKRIHKQIIENLTFTYNVPPEWNIGLCSAAKGTKYVLSPAIACTSNVDCVNALIEKKASFNPYMLTCLAINEQLPRDVRRLADLQEMKTKIEAYKIQNGQAPDLVSGTYIPSLSVSTWDSWQGTLGAALGAALPVDPINALVNSCKATGADPTTCWNEKDKTFTCGVGSKVYQYQLANNQVTLRAELETVSNVSLQGISIAWKIQDPYFNLLTSCYGSVTKGTGTCGDGVLNTPEVCEKGWKIGTAQLQHSCVTAEGYNGSYVYDCPSTCKLYTTKELTDNKLSCVPAEFCGDGKKNGKEACDDGTLNGTYNHCSKDCKNLVSEAGKCGDGAKQLKQGEMCDLGPIIKICYVTKGPKGATICKILPKNTLPPTLKDSGLLPCVNGYCALSGTYCSPTVGCEWADIKETYYGYTYYAFDKSKSCNWDCQTFGPHCGDGVKNGPAEVCDGEDGTVVTGSCTNGKMMKKCTASCKLESKSSCVITDFSGGGLPPAPETTCGDGVVDTAKGEECDDAASNGAVCTALYGSACTYCSKTCKNITISGGACGDKVRQVKEECDGDDLQGKTCANFKTGSKSTLVCTDQCVFDKTVCK